MHDSPSCLFHILPILNTTCRFLWLAVTLFLCYVLTNFFMAILMFPYIFMRQQSMVGSCACMLAWQGRTA